MASNKIDPRILKIVVDGAEDTDKKIPFKGNERVAEILTWLNDVKLDFDIKTMKPIKSKQPDRVLYNGVAKLQVDRNREIIAPQPFEVPFDINDVMYTRVNRN